MLNLSAATIFSIIMKQRHQQKLIILSFILAVVLNAPILLLFNDAGNIGGLPLIYIYIFAIWLISCLVSFIIFKKFDE